MVRRLLNVLVVLVLALSAPASASAQDQAPPEVPVDASGLALPEAITAEVPPALAQAVGQVQVVVRLTDPPLALAQGKNAKQQGPNLSPGEQSSHLAALDSKQADVMNQIAVLGGVQLGRVRIALNALIVSIDASQLGAIAAMEDVISIRPVIEYEVDLLETVPYIGATAVQELGYDGTGVRVAVLDSGIDYTHANLGGSGDVAEFEANDPTVVEPGTFPTEKVVGGYDFVGEVWPDGLLMPDPDPLDKGPEAGHGTHVADIIGGVNGVAPGVELYAVKTCSSVSTSCSGIALLAGVDFALDPNGDGSTDDAVDVINLSLGSNYGQREDDLSQALVNAVEMGVVVVASAGNAADRPYITGSPATAPQVISVAQTQVPSSLLYRIEAGSFSVAGSHQSWSAPVTGVISGVLQYGDGAGGNLNGCAPFAPGSVSGLVVLVDRGTCAISIKVSNIADGGGAAAIIANNAPQARGDLPPDFSFGGGDPSRIPGFSVTLASGNGLKVQLGDVATIDPANAAPLVMNIVSSSARGPSYSYSAIKPDIGAPGGSVSAEYGTGTGETPFSGTSGAAPMVAGSAALLIDAYPDRTPAEIKAMLMNTAETNIGMNPIDLPGYLAPVTRIGGGEVRVDRALQTQTIAWDREEETGSLSFGYHAVTEPLRLRKTIAVHNYSDERRTYTITPTFRYPEDEASGAVTVDVRDSITVGAHRTETFRIELRIDPTKLPQWVFTGLAGQLGGQGSLLQEVEFDGYLLIEDEMESIHLAWHVLPHRAANVEPRTTEVNLRSNNATLQLRNDSTLDGIVDVFALTGTSRRIQKRFLPEPGDNFAIIDLKNVGARLVSIGEGLYGIQFAISTYGARAHPSYPAEFDIYIDVNNDGTDDFVLFNLENVGFGATGQTLIYVANLATGSATAYFYADADLQSSNIIFTAPLEALGMTPTTQIKFSIYAFDNYFSGELTDSVENMVFTPGIPRYQNAWFTVVPAGGSTTLTISKVPGGEDASPSQTGVLLMYRDAANDRESDAIRVRD